MLACPYLILGFLFLSFIFLLVHLYVLCLSCLFCFLFIGFTVSLPYSVQYIIIKVEGYPFHGSLISSLLHVIRLHDLFVCFEYSANKTWHIQSLAAFKKCFNMHLFQLLYIWEEIFLLFPFFFPHSPFLSTFLLCYLFSFKLWVRFSPLLCPSHSLGGNFVPHL